MRLASRRMWKVGDLLMTYKDELTRVMTDISKMPDTMFIGYNTRCGHRFNGTLNGVCEGRCLEMPVAENLIMGVAMGMSLEGCRPIACFERMDFLWACADAIVNHLDKAKQLGWPPLNVVIRTCVGAAAPLDPGCQHCGDYVDAFRSLVVAPVVAIKRAEEIDKVWKDAMKHEGPIMIVEYRELYNKPILPTVSGKSDLIG